MKQIFNISRIFLLIIFLSPAVSWGLPHLWLSTDPGMFDEGGVGYFGCADCDPWLNESYITKDSPFDLYIYNKDKDLAATGISLLIAVHENEVGTGSVTVNGSTYSSFTGILLPSEYGGGNHGIYNDPVTSGHDGRYAIANLGFDLDPKTYESLSISWDGFTLVHFDAISSNGFWNPPSHDVTALPEPGTIMLLGSGLLGVAAYGRKRFKK